MYFGDHIEENLFRTADGHLHETLAAAQDHRRRSFAEQRRDHAAARNAPLAETHRQYNARLWRARFLSSRQIDRRENTLAEHDRIVTALMARDGAATANAMRAHLRSTIENIARVHADGRTKRDGH